MSEVYEYGEDDFEDEIPDEDDEMRRAILEAETNEVWLEEPGDDEDELNLPMNPLFGLFPNPGIMRFPGISNNEKDEESK
ncbi:MAG: hypothetical protein II969_12200 [Anaerolineaceae bacterium]|nr:hypothetical protein [Anaerolineaceae bacterium]